MDADEEVIEVPSSSSSSRKDGQKRFEVIKWNAVALRPYEVVVDSCSICRNHIMQVCIECQAKGWPISRECTIAHGVCKHAFHFHCISRWLKIRDVCPLDNHEWHYLSSAN